MFVLVLMHLYAEFKYRNELKISSSSSSMESTNSLGEYYHTACGAKVGEHEGTRLANNGHEERVYIQVFVKYMQVRVKNETVWISGVSGCSAYSGTGPRKQLTPLRLGDDSTGRYHLERRNAGALGSCNEVVETASCALLLMNPIVKRWVGQMEWQ